MGTNLLEIPIVSVVITRDVRQTCAVTRLYDLQPLFYRGASDVSLDRVSIQLCFYEVRV
jgi:hypothetical protein